MEMTRSTWAFVPSARLESLPSRVLLVSGGCWTNGIPLNSTRARERLELTSWEPFPSCVFQNPFPAAGEDHSLVKTPQ